MLQEVTGRFLAPDGSPLSGSVIFTPTFLFARDSQAVTLPAPVSVKLDAEGRVSASLLVPAADAEPDAWVWEACPQLRGKHGVVKLRDFAFELTADAPVNLAEVTPVPDPVTGEYVTKGDRGEQGPKGEQGETGPMGPAGPQGEQGPQGPGFAASVYRVGNSLRFSWGNPRTGESKTLSVSLPDPIPGPIGPKGDQGETGPVGPVGPAGPRGERGEVGPPGPQGLRGERGEIGLTGPQGPTGLTGPVGPTGPKGEPGNPAAMVLVGVGRPDTPSTLSPENQTAVANALVGATFTSTDGAGVGAWAWVKTPTGWQVTYGDTGWRNITPMVSLPATRSWASGAAGLFIRRELGQIHLSIRGLVASSAGKAGIYQLPAGWRTIKNLTDMHSVPAMNDAGNGFMGKITFWDGTWIESKAAVSGARFDTVCSMPARDLWPAVLPGAPA